MRTYLTIFAAVLFLSGCDNDSTNYNNNLNSNTTMTDADVVADADVVVADAEVADGGVDGFICPDPMPTGMVLCEDFEDGANWDYSDQFALSAEYLADEWDIVSDDPYGGSYCAQSREPGEPVWAGDSTFHIALESNQVFLRFWAKFPLDWQHEATDENGGANFLRAGTGAAGDWSDGMGYNPGWLHIYSWGVRWGVGTQYYKDNLWHEYAFYFDFVLGIWEAFEDAGEDYSTQNSVAHYEGVTYAQPFTHILLPNFYKGPVDGNWMFWIDSIELWNCKP